MKEVYQAAKQYDNQISQALVGYNDEDQHVLIANSEGTFIQDRRVRTRFKVQAVASRNRSSCLT